MILLQTKKTVALLSFLLLLQFGTIGQTNPTAQYLPFSQNFSGFNGSQTSYPAGFQGWNITGSSGSYPTGSGSGDFTLAGGTNATTTAGVYDMNGKMGLLITSSTQKTMCLALVTKGLTNIAVSYDAATQAQTSGGRKNNFILQYRVGTSGTFTAITASAYINDAASNNTTGTSSLNVTAISVTLPTACENQNVVQLRWVAKDSTGTGSRPSFSVDNILVKSTTTPNIVKSSPSQIAAANISQGVIDQPISNFRVGTTSSYASLTSLAFKTKGTYTTASDITNFKLWYNASANTFGSASQIGTTQSSVTSGSTVTFSSLTTNIIVDSTGYFWISTTLPSNATIGSTIYTDTAYTFTFTLSNQSGSINSGGTQTIIAVTPTISLSNGNIVAANVTQNTVSNLLYRTGVAVSNTSATLNTVNLTTAGTYSSSDLTNLKLWYKTDSNFSSATLLATKTTSLGAGSQSFSSLSQTFAIGTAYLFVSMDVPCAATASNTINIAAISSTSLSFASGTPTGSGFTSGGTQTFIPSTPVAPTSVSAAGTGTIGQIRVSWTNPTGCYNEVMIVAAPDTNSGIPTGNGGAYTANLIYDSGSTLGNGHVVYKGSSSPQIITGLTNGSNYFFKVYTRWDTAWVAATEVISSPYKTPVLTQIYLPQYMQGTSGTNSNRVPFVYRVRLDSLTPYASYRYINQVVTSADGSSIAGAGNEILIDSNNNFTRTTAAGINTAGGYGAFTADSAGKFTGWFVTEPTGNTRFAAGTKVYMNLGLNNGNGGTTVQVYLRTPDSVTVINLNTTQTANDGSGLYGVSHANAKNMVLVYDNENGTGRPISSGIVEDNTITEPTGSGGYASFFTTNVSGTATAWGTIIPNTNLSNGIRRVEFLDNLANSVYAVTSSNGVWNANSTVNPNAGTTAVKLPRTGCSKLIVNQNTTLGSSLNISSTITLNGGTLNVGTNTLTDTGTVTRVAGNMSLSSGKIIFANSSPVSIPSNSFTGSIAKLSVIGSASVTLPSSQSVTDTLTNSDTINGTIIMSGSAAQKIIGTGVISSLFINNSNGVTISSGDKQTITTALTCSSGILTSDTSSTSGIILGSSGIISESNSSYLNGRLYTNRTLAQNTTNTFGGLGLSITEATQSTNDYAVTRITGTPITSGNGGAFNGNQGVKRYYTITPTTNTGLSAQVIFYYRDGELNGITEGNLRIYTHADPYTNGSWADLGGKVIINTSANTIKNDPDYPISHFSTWSFSSDAQALPVELVKLTGRLQNGVAVINWIAANEDPNSTYQITQGSDIHNTHLIGTETALANGESVAYELLHHTPYRGINYYQLWVTEGNGTSRMLGQIALDNKGENHNTYSQVQLFPNPTANSLQVLLGNAANTTSKVSITNATGSVVMQQALNGQNAINLDLTQLPAGVYHIAIYGTAGELLQGQRFVKN